MMARYNYDDLSSAVDNGDLLVLSQRKQLFNYGDLTTSGPRSAGIVIATPNAVVDNYGDITTSGDGSSGIVVGTDLASQDGARVRNYGTISTSGFFADNDGDGEFSTGDEYSDAISVTGNSNRIENYGAVIAQNADTIGIIAIGDANVVNNYGRIEAQSGYVIDILGSGNQVANYGTLIGSGPFSDALLIEGTDNHAVNYGKIVAETFRSGGMSNFGDDSSVINYGTIVTLTGGSTEDGGRTEGLYSSGSNNLVENHGRLQIAGDNNRGISMFGAGNVEGGGGSGLNDGTITTSGFGSIGVLVANVAAFDNSGLIRTTGVAAIGLRSESAVGDLVQESLVNHGRIVTEGDGAAGVYLFGNIAIFGKGNVHFENDGVIRTSGGAGVGPEGGPEGAISASAIIAIAGGAEIVNAGTGVLVTEDASVAAVQLGIKDGESDSGGSGQSLENDGLIRSAGVAIVGGDTHQLVTNTGRIVGDVDLGGGHDTYQAESGGHLDGILTLGDGDDRLVIARGAGSITISDFTAGRGNVDEIDLTAFGLGSFDQVLAHAVAVDGDVEISFGAGTHVILQSVSLADLVACDFVL